MANEPIPNDPSDDELESLAEDLFGVSLNQEDELEPFDVGDFDLDEDDGPKSESEVLSESGTEAETRPSPEASQPVVADAGDDFGASLLDEEEPPPPPPAKTVSKPSDLPRDEVLPEEIDVAEVDTSGSDSSEISELELDEDESADVSEPDASEDDYWDALDGFDWDEGSDPAEPAAATRKEYVEATESFEDFSVQSAAKSDEYLDDSEFGAGLDEAEEAIAPAEHSPAEDGEERSGRRRKRGGRRRGRRGRSSEVAKETSGDPDQPTKESKSASESRQDDVPTESDDEGFGAGLDVETPAEEPPDEEDGTRKRRRRGGRRRGRRSKSTEETTASTTSESTEKEKPEPAEKGDKYRSVPTWEEAISYLVRKEPRKSSNGSRSSGSRRGRRGSGRRRNG